MSKNLTRKGIALGALIALGTSLFAGTPAQAAGELTIAPSQGTKWAVPSKNNFAVKANFTAGYSSTEFAKLKFKLTTNGGFRLNADAAASEPGDNASASTSAVALGSTSGVVATAATDGSATWIKLGVNSAAADTTYTATITAFIDADSDGVLDTGEWASTTETVSFIKDADVNWTASTVEPVRGTTSNKVYITSTNINLAQLDTYIATSDVDSQVAAVFALNGTDAWVDGGTPATNTVAAGDYEAVVASYNSDDDRLEATSPTFATLAAGDVVKASVYWTATAGPAGVASTNTNLDALLAGADGFPGTTNANATAVATSSKSVPAAVVTGAGAVTSDATLSNTAVSGNAAKVAPDATSVVATSTVSYATGKSASDVVFTISENTASGSGYSTIDAAASLSSGGKTLKNANGGKVEYIEVTVKSDSDGLATLNIATAGLKNGNSFTVEGKVQGYTATLATYTVEDRKAGSLKNMNAIGTNSDSAVLVFAKDAAFTLNYSVLDQYGKGLDVAGHSVTVSDGTNSWSASVSSGRAAVAVPAYTSETSKTMTPTVYKNGVDVTISEPTAAVKIATSKAAASVTGTGATGYDADHKEDLNLKAQKSADTRTGASAPAVTAGTNVVITGTVKDANLEGTISSVTLTGAGLMFEADGVWSVGSITVQTAVDGTYVADVYSNKAGKKVVTIKAGSATTTEELFFADAADDAGETLSVIVPSLVKAGNALVVKGTLVDAFGNPVTADGTDEDFNVTYTGPGFAGTIPTSVNADGSFRFYVLLGSNDSGVATIEVAYDLDEDGDYTDTGDILVTKTVLVGMSAKITKAATSTVVVKNATGETIKVVRGKKSKTVVATSASQKVSLKGGTGTVKVYVNGVKLASK